MAKETKIGLLLILVLLGAFGFVVFRQYNKDGSLLAKITSTLNPDKKPVSDDTNVIRPTTESGEQEQSTDKFAFAAEQSEPPQQQQAAHPFDRKGSQQQAMAPQQDGKRPSENPFEAYGRSRRHGQHSHEQKPRTQQTDGSRSAFGSRTKQHSHPHGAHSDEQQRVRQHGSHQHANDRSDQSQQPESPKQDAQYDWKNLVAQEEPVEPQQSVVQQDPFGSGNNSSKKIAQQQQQQPNLASTDDLAQSTDSTPVQKIPTRRIRHSHGKDDEFNPFGKRLPTHTHQSSSHPADQNAQQSTQALTDLADTDSARQQVDPPATASPFGNQSRQSIAAGRSDIARQRHHYHRRTHNKDWSAASSDRARIKSQDSKDRGNSSFHPNTAQAEQNSGTSEVTDSFDRRQASRKSRSFEHAKRGTAYGAASSDRGVDVYVVQPNDNYWNISKKQYGTAKYFTALARYNEAQIPDPKLMRPGMKIRVPKAQVLETRYPELCPHPSATIASSSARGSQGTHNRGFFRNAAGHPMFHVDRHDTLTAIAKAHLGRASRWIQIYELNREHLENPKSLKIGTDLRLPGDARPVRLVHSPRANR